MSRKDCVWVAIKVFGIYMAVEAMLMVPNLMSTFRLLDDVTGRYSGQAATSAGWLTFMHLHARFVLLAVGGIYFLKSGRLVYWLIGPIAEAEAKPE